MPLLDVRDLRVSFDTPDGAVHAVRGLSFAVDTGRTLGLVGESGSGKTVTVQTITGLTRGARVSGAAYFDGLDMVSASQQQLREIRGARIGMIFQDPLSSLHPHYRIGRQIVEVIHAHERSTSRSAVRRRAVELLGRVGIPDPESRLDDYPHQFSGGMRQRAMIAMAMVLNPALLIADEPTTALDVTVQAQVLDVMRGLQRDFGTAIILVTHDLGIVAEMADEIVVMYAGAAMERAPRRELFYHHHHPYTEGMLGSLPGQGDAGQRLAPIPGNPPSLLALPHGCPFAPRCRYAFDLCNQKTPPLAAVFGRSDHVSACWLPSDEQARRRASHAVQEAA